MGGGPTGLQSLHLRSQSQPTCGLMSWSSPIPKKMRGASCPALLPGWASGMGPALLAQEAPVAPTPQAAPGPSDLEGQETTGKSIS